MLLPKFDPEYAYLSTSLFLPRKFVQEGPIRGALTFGVTKTNEDRVLVNLHPHHLEVPRAFLTNAEMSELGLKVIDLRPKSFPPSSLRPKPSFQLRKKQEPAWAAFDIAKQGVLQLPCGGGKCVMGLLKIASLETTALVMSWQKAHLENWEKELHKYFDLDGPVGWVSGSKCEYEREVVFATIQTLAKRVRSGGLPEDFHERFGTIIFDEVHHLSSEHFTRTADLFVGNRFGLTATPNRIDRCEGIFYAHLGPLVYQSNEQDLTAEIVVVPTGIDVPEKDEPEITDVSGQRNISMLRGWLAHNADRNTKILETIKAAQAEGRTVYALSHSVEHVKWLHEMFPNSGLIHGKVKSKERLNQLNSFPLVFVTMDVGKENYNRPALDTLLLLTPFAAYEHAAPSAQQSTGRIERIFPGKKDPRVYLFMDDVPECRGMCFSFLKWADKTGHAIKDRNQWIHRRNKSR